MTSVAADVLAGRTTSFAPFELLRYAVVHDLERPETVKLTRARHGMLHLSAMCAGSAGAGITDVVVPVDELCELRPSELCDKRACASFDRPSGALAVMIDPFDNWFSYLTELSLVTYAAGHAADTTTAPEAWLRLCAAHESNLDVWSGPFGFDAALAQHAADTLEHLVARRTSLAGACDRSILANAVTGVLAIAAEYNRARTVGTFEGACELVGFGNPARHRSIEVSFEPSDIETLTDVAYLCAAVSVDAESGEFFAVVPSGFHELLQVCDGAFWPGAADITPLGTEFALVATGTAAELEAMSETCRVALGLRDTRTSLASPLEQRFELAALVLAAPTNAA